MRRHRILTLAAGAALVLAVALAACESRLPPLDVSTPLEQEIRVTLRDDFTITANPDRIRPGRARVTATNEGSMQHGFAIEGIGIEQFIAPGTSLNQETVFPSGTWIIFCPVTDHRQRGMQGQFVVS